MIAIFPFEAIMPAKGEAANLVRFIRIGRITKMLKLMKMLRLMRLQKESSFNLTSWLTDIFRISPEMRWFFKFFCMFAMITHVVACFWIISGSFDPDTENTWIYIYTGGAKDWMDGSKLDLYMTSVYFTITTITTVGYGDMSATTFNEKIISIFIMLAGVIAFSMASGALTNYIAQQDEKSEKYESKMSVLDQLFKDYNFS